MKSIMQIAAEKNQARVNNGNRCPESCIALEDYNLCSCCVACSSIERAQRSLALIADITDPQIILRSLNHVICILRQN